jgi:hypothetical protein
MTQDESARQNLIRRWQLLDRISLDVATDRAKLLTDAEVEKHGAAASAKLGHEVGNYLRSVKGLRKKAAAEEAGRMTDVEIEAFFRNVVRPQKVRNKLINTLTRPGPRRPRMSKVAAKAAVAALTDEQVGVWLQNLRAEEARAKLYRETKKDSKQYLAHYQSLFDQLSDKEVLELAGLWRRGHESPLPDAGGVAAEEGRSELDRLALAEDLAKKHSVLAAAFRLTGGMKMIAETAAAMLMDGKGGGTTEGYYNAVAEANAKTAKQVEGPCRRAFALALRLYENRK